MKSLPPFQIIFEDNHLLVVNKSAGLLVQGDKTGDNTLIDACKKYIKEKYKKPGDVFLGLVHRLDRPVSGLVVLARTSKALERMSRIFHDRKIQKKYWAVVKKKPRNESSKLINWLKKDPSRNIVASYNKEILGSQKAELKYRVLGKLNEHYLLEVEPLTGRPHQIRVQLSEMGCPIRGDLKYGFHKPNKDGNINLHARSLYFTHPVKKSPLTLKAALPEDDFWEQFLLLDK
ncbi:RluA family pseudouridine synthase [Bacteroidota bacterium]